MKKKAIESLEEYNCSVVIANHLPQVRRRMALIWKQASFPGFDLDKKDIWINENASPVLSQEITIQDENGDIEEPMVDLLVQLHAYFFK